jgi:hypothetical protein
VGTAHLFWFPGFEEKLAMLEGHIRGLSQHYVDGLERMEIWVNKQNAAPLPFQDGIRIPIRLKIGTTYYDAGLRATSRNTYVWICPDLKDSHGEKISLAMALINSGFEINQRINIVVKDNVVPISPIR